MKRKRFSTKAAKVEWLLANEHQWQGFPSEWLHMKEGHRKLAKNLAEQMQAIGMVSMKTNPTDINMFSLIQAARIKRRMMKARTEVNNGN